MGIVFENNLARLEDFVGVDDAEGLLEWLQTNSKGLIDLSSCSHLHAANLQVLMATRPEIAAWPADASLATWLKTALEPQGD